MGSAGSPLSCRHSGERWLSGRLEAALSKVHPEPGELHDEADLVQILLALYAKPARSVWTQDVEPFLNSHEEALRLLYDEHRALPEAHLLDLIEAPLILERLENDSARLARDWPLDRASLRILSAAWGRPIYEAA
jgi:hypothetical protein